MPNLLRIGWGNMPEVSFHDLAIYDPEANVGKCAEASKGKDTTTGHWEIAGLPTDVPFKTYPNGFPQDFMEAYQKAIGIECLGNYPASGTEIIEVLGDEHEATGKPIVYTSADSVFQIAMNVDKFGLDTLYHYCEVARKMLVGDWACGRVIARPYIINAEGKRERTSDRKDYSVTPPGDTILDMIKNAGKMVYAIGKIHDIFAGRGMTEFTYTSGNTDGLAKTLAYADKDFHGLCFVNLVDFDMLYGHRRNPDGYAAALQEFDSWLPGFLEKLREDDCVIITADHGCDPGYRKHTDHTREYIPMIALGKKIRPVNLGTRAGFCDIAATVTDLLGVPYQTPGRSFAAELV